MALYPIKALTKAVKAVTPVIHAKHQVPACRCVQFHADGTVSGDNLDVRATVRAALVGVDALAPLKSLKDALKAFKGVADVDVAPCPDGAGVVLPAGGTAITVPGPALADAPKARQVEPEAPTVRLSSGVWADVARRVASACSTDETRYTLNGVFLKGTDDAGLVAVATDGHRLAKLDVDAGAVAGLIPRGIIVPRHVFAVLGEKAGAVTMRVGGSHVELRDGETVVVARLIDGRFPDYAQVIPKAEKATVHARLDAGMSLAGAEAVKARWKVAGAGTFPCATLNLDAESMEHDGAQVKALPGEYTRRGKDPCGRTGINAGYLADMVTFAHDGSCVSLAFEDALSPIVATLGAYTHLVMPARI